MVAEVKYRDLSAAAAKTPPSVEMTWVWWWVGREQATAKETTTTSAKYRDLSTAPLTMRL